MAKIAVVVIACILAALPGQVGGQTCLEPLGHWGYGSTRAAVWVGELAVVASGQKLLVVDFRLAVPEQIVGELRLPGDPIAFAADGDLVFAGIQGNIGADDLVVAIDLSLPADPLLLGRHAIGGTLSDVAVQGTVAFVASRSEGLVVIDASDPSRLRRLATLPAIDVPKSIAVRSDVAYIGSFTRLTAVDVSSPASPSVVSSQSIDGSSVGSLFLSDPYLYFLSSDTLTVFDLADPMRPLPLGSLEVDGGATHLGAAGTTVFVTHWGGSAYFMDVVDASVGSQPRYVATYAPGVRPYHIAATDDQVLLSLGANGAQLVDVSDLETPRLAAKLPPPAPPGDMVDAAVDGGLAFLADTGGLFRTMPPVGLLRVLDVADPGEIREIATLGFDEPVRQVAVDGDHVLVLRGEEEITPMTLEVVDVADPSKPAVEGSLQLSGPPWGELVVSDHHAYLTDWGLHIVDLSDPTNPVKVGETNGAGGSGNALAVAGDRAYLAGGLGLCIVDVSDPANPVQISCTSVGGYGSSVAVKNGVAFVGVHPELPRPPWTDELRVLDISDETAPVPVGAIELWGIGGRSHLHSDLLFVEVVGRGLLAVDVSHPSAPKPAGLARVDAVGVGSGDLFFAASGFGGLDVFGTGSCLAPAPTPDFVWHPEVPTLGEEVVFTDLTLGGPASWSWQFGGGASSADQNPVHSFTTPGMNTVSLTASNGNGAATSERWVPVQSIASPLREAWIVPAAAHTDGMAGTRWRTDLTLATGNDGGEAVLYLMKQGEDNSLQHGERVSLEPGATALDDVVATVFGEEQASGAVFITSSSGFWISSRTYASGDDGTFGQFIPAIGWRHEPSPVQTLIQLTQNDGFRTNLGLVNRVGVPLTVQADLYSNDGALLAGTSYDVEPFGHLQVNGFIAELVDHPLDDGYVTLVGGDDSDFLAYASAVDNTTGDPAFMLPPVLGDSDIPPIWIPAVAHVAGRNGTLWRSDVEVCAAAGADTEFRLELYETGSAGAEPASEVFALAAGRCVRYADVVGSVFDRAVTGALRIVPTTGSLVAGSRTYTRRSDGGTYGQFIPAVREFGIQRPKQVRILQLAHSADPDAGYRTNVGLLNFAVVPIDVHLEVRSQDETVLYETEVRLEPSEHRQINRFLEGIGAGDLVNATLVVQSWSIDANYFVYASVVDNASGDAVFMSP